MSVTDQNGWGEVERRARQYEELAAVNTLQFLLEITPEDRLRGAVVEALGLLEGGHPTAAHQVLQDALKIQ